MAWTEKRGKWRMRLTEKSYQNKVLGCWMGKNIGGTLGLPYEGLLGPFNLTFYDPVPTESIPNDDLELQVLWLQVIRHKGVDFTELDLAEAWLNQVKYGAGEYGSCIANLRRGLTPPISGAFCNWFIDCLGVAIRTEIWACLAPGDPELAATLAFRDGILDHTIGSEGINGALFLAAVESAAFVESSIETLLQTGLAMIPASSLTARCIKDVIRMKEKNMAWQDVRAKIIEKYAEHWHMSYVPVNLGFIVLGWLEGRDDFETSLLRAVNCGFDSDCTAATIGAIQGIILGLDGIPKRWKDPVGAKLVISNDVQVIEPEKDIYELTEVTNKWRKEFEKHRDKLVTKHPSELNKQNPDMGMVKLDSRLFSVDYKGNPSIKYDIPKTVEIVGLDEFDIDAPKGWKVDRCGNSVTFTAKKGSGRIVQSNKIAVSSAGQEATFALIGEQIWKVGGKRVFFPDYEINLAPYAQGKDVVRAETKFVLSDAGVSRILVTTESPFKAWVDGQMILHNPYTSARMEPNAVAAIWKNVHADRMLAAGEHTLTVELAVMPSRDPMFVWYMTKPDEYPQHRVDVDFVC